MVNYQGTGRRKAAVARVWIKKGTGNVLINGIPHTEYFDTDFTKSQVVIPFKVTSLDKAFDVHAVVSGGGLAGQAGAVRLGIARALIEAQAPLRPTLKKNGLLSVDSRIKERKKYGQRGARRKFQFVKR